MPWSAPHSDLPAGAEDSMSTTLTGKLHKLEMIADEQRQRRDRDRVRCLVQAQGVTQPFTDVEVDDALRQAESSFRRVLGPRSSWSRVLTKPVAARLAEDSGVPLAYLIESYPQSVTRGS
jgi:hypothetical protein